MQSAPFLSSPTSPFSLYIPLHLLLIDATMAQLLRDYELQDHRDRTNNFNRFMAFIGSPMRQVFSPTAGDAPIGTRGS